MSIKAKVSMVKRLILNDAHSPLWGQIFITRRCDLRCPFCAAPLHKADELSPDQWFKALDILSAWGVKVLNIVGGEPTLYSGLWDVLNYARAQGFITVLHSNLRNPDPNLVSRMVQSGVYALEASIDSLDGSLPKSSPHVLDILNDAKDNGVLPFVCTVITEANVKQVSNIARLVTDAGFAYLVAVYQTVGGRFSTTDSKMIPSDYEIERVFFDLIELKKRTSLIKNSFYFLENPQIHHKGSWHCDGSKDVWIAIDSDGSLMPCQEYRSNISIFSFEKYEGVQLWRKEKSSITTLCKGCSYHCYVEAEALMGMQFLREMCSYAIGIRKLTHPFLR